MSRERPTAKDTGLRALAGFWCMKPRLGVWLVILAAIFVAAMSWIAKRSFPRSPRTQADVASQSSSTSSHRLPHPEAVEPLEERIQHRDANRLADGGPIAQNSSPWRVGSDTSECRQCAQPNHTRSLESSSSALEESSAPNSMAQRPDDALLTRYPDLVGVAPEVQRVGMAAIELSRMSRTSPRYADALKAFTAAAADVDSSLDDDERQTVARYWQLGAKNIGGAQ